MRNLERDGYLGVFTRDSEPGAIPNGARIVKVKSEVGDANPVGTLGTVLGSIRAPAEVGRRFPGVVYFYFVEWDSMPRMAVGVFNTKIEPCEC
jgi:hypothetical protein